MKTIHTVIIISMLMGCATMDDALKGKGEKCSRIFNAPFEQTWNAVPPALKTVKLYAVRYNEKAHYILAESINMVDTGTLNPIALPIEIFINFVTPPGDNVVIFIDPVENKSTKVEIITNKKFKGSVTIDWGNIVLNELEKILTNPAPSIINQPQK